MEKVLVLIRLDSTDIQKYVFCGKEIVIGRGSSLGCDDKRVSRNHGSLQRLDDGSFVLEAHNTNPCFYKTQAQDTYAVLMKGQKKTLFIGDEFSLLPHSFCYQLAVKNEVLPLDDNAVQISNSIVASDAIKCENVESPTKNKRKLPQWLHDLAKSEDMQSTSKVKKIKQQKEELLSDEKPTIQNIEVPRINDSANQEPSAENEEPNNNDLEPETSQIKSESCNENSSLKCVDEPKCHEQVDTESDVTGAADEEDTNQKTTPNNGTDQGQGGSSSTASRDPCIYGKDCFRKNAQHRTDFSHPGDADFEANTDVPECQYGTSCYRKNLQHRKDFKHTKRMPRAAAQAPTTSNVFCTNCTISYHICTRCQRLDTDEVIDLTGKDL